MVWLQVAGSDKIEIFTKVHPEFAARCKVLHLPYKTHGKPEGHCVRSAINK